MDVDPSALFMTVAFKDLQSYVELWISEVAVFTRGLVVRRVFIRMNERFTRFCWV